MDKQEIVSFIEGQLASGKISKDDLLSLVGGGSANQAVNNDSRGSSSRRLIHVFYAIGAIIAVVGVTILIAENWEEIGFLGRILVTLGISLITYITALLFRSPEQNVISQVMFTISAALAPLGAFVLLSEASIDFTSSTQFLTASALFVLFGVALFISRRSILVLITLGFATWAYYALLVEIFDFNYNDIDFLKWGTMLLGASYMLIAYGYQSLMKAGEQSSSKEKKAVKDILYGLGSIAILGAGISIGGIFDLLFIALIFAAFYGSVFLRSRAMLSFGAVFLIAHIIKLTSKYFADSVGWPVMLIVVGFLVIGVGYMTYYLNRKFISPK